ncbi:Uridine kinase [Flexibacter flexilis DSM 6793]|uniref:Phosphoribulokinase n=1 Tax=Flexibacter flexilis DSM 6793 TaxID=927664 RepID=A0A1I1H0G3_9BACT|nr:GtrA family protein [Flexibacter flexilis]SFC17271.1 Uridine kinase [Flexibacter flexilis DSM 6793]
MNLKSPIIQQILRFAVVGGFSTAVNYSTFYALLQLLDINYLAASATGFLVGVVVGYFFNKKWTFNAETASKNDWWKYATVYLCSLICGLVFLYIVVDKIGVYKPLGNLLSIILTTIINFIGTRFWVFNNAQHNTLSQRLKFLVYDQRGFFRYTVLMSPIFLIGFLIKLVLASTLASNYLVDLFAPFVNYYVSSGFQNPYDYFVAQGSTNAFPYPPLMLYILSIPRVLLSPFWSGNYNEVGHLAILAYRLPLLAADTVILYILSQWLKRSHVQLLWWYWLNPVLIYISYVHGQLDSLPIALLFISLYTLFRERVIISAIFLGLSIATKFNMVLVVPFYCLYLYRQNDNIIKTSYYAAIIAATVIVLNLPFAFSAGFWKMVYANTEQAKIFDVSYPFGPNLVLYAVPAALLIVLVRSLTMKTFSRDVFIMFLAFAFGVILFFVPPMQGWHYWSIPFFIYYYLKEDEAPKIVFGLFIASYLLYFFVQPQSDYVQVFQLINNHSSNSSNFYGFMDKTGLPAPKILYMSFTVLQTLLAVNVLWIYQKGLKRNMEYKLRTMPFLLGIGGDSGSGKSSLTQAIGEVLDLKNVTIVRGDDMHKWERGHDKWQEYTHLNPQANHLQSDVYDLGQLVQGNKVQRRHYDHNKGTFTLPLFIKPAKLVIFEGLHTFYLKESRDRYDLKIFVQPEEALRVHWKVRRDMKKRGYSREKVLTQLKQREEDSKKFIQTQAIYADIIVSFSSRVPLPEPGIEGVEPDLELNFICNNHINLDNVINEIGELESLEVRVHYDEHNRQHISFYGQADRNALMAILYEHIPDFEEVNWRLPQIRDGYSGIMQVLITYAIFQKR